MNEQAGLGANVIFFLSESGIDPSGLRTHSCRRTAAYYAAWQGIPEATIKVIIGLWYKSRLQ